MFALCCDCPTIQGANTMQGDKNRQSAMGNIAFWWFFNTQKKGNDGRNIIEQNTFEQIGYIS